MIMRRVFVCLFGLAWSLGVADDVHVVDRVEPDTPELQSQQSQAVAAREALTALLNGVQSEPVVAEEETASELSTPRAEAVRDDEQSVGRIPENSMPSHTRRKFTALRDKLLHASDIVIVADELQTFVDTHPGHREAVLTLGRLQILLDQPATALHTIAGLLLPLAEKSHPDWQPWFWAGTAYLSTGQYDQARRSLDVAIAKDGSVVDIWVQLAVLEQELDNHAGALQYVAIAEQLDPGAAEVYLNRAYSLEQLGRFREALLAYQQFLVTDMTLAAGSLRPSILRRIAAIAAAVSDDGKSASSNSG